MEVMFPGLTGRADLIPMAREGGLYGAYEVLNVPGQVIGHPRVQGGLKVIGGAGETVVGGVGVVSTSPTVAGSVVSGLAVLHGIDTVQSGWRQMWNGTYTPSFTAQGLTVLTGSPEAGELLDATAGIGFSLGSGLLTQGPRVGIMGGRATQFYNPARGDFGPSAIRALTTSPTNGAARIVDGPWWSAAQPMSWVAPSAAQDMNWFQRMMTGVGFSRNYVEFDVVAAELSNPGGLKFLTVSPWQQTILGGANLTGRNAVWGQLAPNIGQAGFYGQTGALIGEQGINLWDGMQY